MQNTIGVIPKLFSKNKLIHNMMKYTRQQFNTKIQSKGKKKIDIKDPLFLYIHPFNGALLNAQSYNYNFRVTKINIPSSSTKAKQKESSAHS